MQRLKAACFLLLMMSSVAPVRAASPDTVRVLIYNILHGVGMDGRLDLARAAAVIRGQRPDVVLLQEVDRGTERANGVAQAQELARLTGLPHHAFGAFMDYDGGQYGMAVLSVWPIRAHENHVLPPGEEPRSALAARIRPGTSAPEMVFAGVHLYRTEAERFAQARRLVAVFEDEPAPVLLAGDFNSEPGDPVMRLLGTYWKMPAKPTAVRRTWPADAPKVEIDYVLYRPPALFTVVEHRVLDEPLVSDHRPVLLVLAVEE